MSSANVLEYEGSNFLRQRLILSSLSGHPVKIKKIRHQSESPGLQDFEANLLKLIDKITNGTKIVISVTGTTLFYKPGILLGGKIEHDCNIERGIGYYLEVLLCLSPFCKNPVNGVLTGVTNGSIDPSVDYIKCTSLPIMRRFGVGAFEGLELKINKRGVSPGGGGEIFFQCPVVRKLRTLQVTEQGMIKRIRGVAYATRVSTQTPNRIIHSAREILNAFLPDIYIYSDHMKGPNSGKSPGFGITLYAETTKEGILAAEFSSLPQGSKEEQMVPEDVGKMAANSLMVEICSGGCVDSCNQYLAALYLVLGEKDVGKMLTGPLSTYTIEFLRHIRDFFHVIFKLQTINHDSDAPGGKIGLPKVLLTCVGVGFLNINKSLR